MLIIGLGIGAGVLIGAAGIGGVILVPALVHLAGIEVHAAIAAATMSYIATGLVGTALYARAKSIKWEMTGWLSAAAIPTALAGAFAANFVSGTVLETAIALLAASSGVHTLLNSKETFGARAISNRTLALLGGVTGFTSALTGTGGPLVLVPLLLWLDCAVLTAVGLSQVIQLPIAAVATAGNFYNDNLDPRVGGWLALAVTLGIWAGSKIAHTLPRAALRPMVATLLVSVGALIFGKVAASLIGST
jgi:uncharacterized protein